MTLFNPERERRESAYHDLVKQICDDAAIATSAIVGSLRTVPKFFTVQVTMMNQDEIHEMLMQLVLKYVDLAIIHGDYRVEAVKKKVVEEQTPQREDWLYYGEDWQ